MEVMMRRRRRGKDEKKSADFYYFFLLFFPSRRSCFFKSEWKLLLHDAFVNDENNTWFSNVNALFFFYFDGDCDETRTT